MPHVRWGGHTERMNDGNSVVWPPIIETPDGLPFNLGDWFFAWRGSNPACTAQSEDGLTTFQLGSYQNAGLYTQVGAGYGSGYAQTGGLIPYSWDGPYLSIAPQNVGLILMDEDLASQFEHFATAADWVDAATGLIPIMFRSGWPTIFGEDILPNAVMPLHLHPSHAATGTFVGAKARLVGSGSSGVALYFVAANAGDALEFHTSDGSGDADTPLGGLAGAYVIATCQSGLAAGDTGYQTRPVIYTSPGPVSPACPWPAGGAARAMIAFCHLFPGSSSGPTVVPGGGSLGPGEYTVRYCFTKTLTLQTNGGGTVTQTIETPLSTAADVTIATGTTNALTFTIPPVPTGWDGVRLYGAGPGAPANAAPGLFSLVPGTHYSVSGSTYTVTQISLLVGALTPSYGFSAWQTGTLLRKDLNAARYYLMRWAHVGPSINAKTGNYSLTPYNAEVGVSDVTANDTGSISLAHLFAANTYDATARPVLGQNGSGELAWVPGTASSYPPGPAANALLMYDGTTEAWLGGPAAAGQTLQDLSTTIGWGFPSSLISPTGTYTATFDNNAHFFLNQTGITVTVNTGDIGIQLSPAPLLYGGDQGFTWLFHVVSTNGGAGGSEFISLTFQFLHAFGSDRYTAVAWMENGNLVSVTGTGRRAGDITLSTQVVPGADYAIHVMIAPH